MRIEITKEFETRLDDKIKIILEPGYKTGSSTILKDGSAIIFIGFTGSIYIPHTHYKRLEPTDGI